MRETKKPNPNTMLCYEKWGGTCKRPITAPKYDCGEGHNARALSNSLRAEIEAIAQEVSLQKFDQGSMREQKVSSLLQSGLQKMSDRFFWQKWTSVQSRFFTYSFLNTLLITQQMPDAIALAEMPIWELLGRTVIPGSEGVLLHVDAPSDTLYESAVENYDISQTKGEQINRTPNLPTNEVLQSIESLTQSEDCDTLRSLCGMKLTSPSHKRLHNLEVGTVEQIVQQAFLLPVTTNDAVDPSLYKELALAEVFTSGEKVQTAASSLIQEIKEHTSHHAPIA